MTTFPIPIWDLLNCGLGFRQTSDGLHLHPHSVGDVGHVRDILRVDVHCCWDRTCTGDRWGGERGGEGRGGEGRGGEGKECEAIIASFSSHNTEIRLSNKS